MHIIYSPIFYSLVGCLVPRAMHYFQLISNMMVPQYEMREIFIFLFCSPQDCNHNHLIPDFPRLNVTLNVWSAPSQVNFLNGRILIIIKHFLLSTIIRKNTLLPRPTPTTRALKMSHLKAKDKHFLP